MPKRYAKGRRAYAFSQRTGKRVAYRRLVRDGQTGLLVAPEEWEPKHPQEIPLRDLDDAINLRRPMPDNFDAEQLTIEMPGMNPTTFEAGSEMYGMFTIKTPTVV